MGHRKFWMHSLSGFDASQIPEAMMGIEARMAMKLSIAVRLLLTPIGIMGWFGFFFWDCRKCSLESGGRKELSLRDLGCDRVVRTSGGGDMTMGLGTVDLTLFNSQDFFLFISCVFF